MRKSLFALGCILAVARVAAGTPLYSSLQVTNGMAAASRPDVGGQLEIEAADDFIIGGAGAAVTEFKLIGLLTGGLTPADINFMNLEIYRVFPNDSTNPPSGLVPTRVNSPSDVAFKEVDTLGPDFTFTTTQLAGTFTAANSVLNGINHAP